MRYAERHDDSSLHAQSDFLLCLQRRKDETFSRSCHFHCDSGATAFHWIGDASYKCQSEHGTHTYGCIFRGIARAQSPLCAVRTQLLKANKQQNKGSCLSNSPFIWKPTWDSLTRVLLKLPLLGLSRLLPERCVHSAWQSRPRDTAVTTSTSPTPRDP